MHRAIEGFFTDDEGHWAARLSCGHGRHVRHNPPMVSRPWVLTEAGRSTQLGTLLRCVKCERLELPDGVAPYKQTRAFTEETVPAGLLADHTTRRGVWGRIEVTRGALRYRIPGLGYDEVLTPGQVGIVPPEVPHSVTPQGPVTFSVVFCRLPS